MVQKYSFLDEPGGHGPLGVPQLIALVPGPLDGLVQQLQLVVGRPLHVSPTVLHLPEVRNHLVEVGPTVCLVDEILDLLGIVVGEGAPEVG